MEYVSRKSKVMFESVDGHMGYNLTLRRQRQKCIRDRQMRSQKKKTCLKKRFFLGGVRAPKKHVGGVRGTGGDAHTG